MALEPDTKPERLLSLLIVLMAAENGLLKDEIYRAVRGYTPALNPGASQDAIDKKFDRDKNSLRELGVQLETFNLDTEVGDNTQIRYRIRRTEFVWPKNTQLTANQLRLLELASKVWARASLSSEAGRAITRLKALGVPGDSLDLSGFAPRILTSEPGFLMLEQAARDGIEVSFNYRKPDQQIEKRVVQPWQLRNISGQWLLVCLDLERGEPRNFLLRRIVSRITPSGMTFEPATPEQVATANSLLDEFIEGNLATIKVEPNTEAWVHFDLDAPASDPDGVHSFHYMDLALLADELRQYGKTVQVLAPEELKLAVRKGFEKVANEHA